MSQNRRALWIAVIILSATVLAACNGTPAEPSTDPVEPGQPPAEPVSPDDSVSVSNPDNSEQPVSSDDPPAALPTPTRIAGDVIEGQAIVNSFEVLVLESFPVQITLVVRGNLPDGCTTINQSSSTRSGDTFTVTITTVRPADAICTEALVPFEENIGLDVFGLAAGTYTVIVNNITGSFALDMDNVPQQPPSDQSNTSPPSSGGLPNISSFDVQVSNSPLTVVVNFQGILTDGCTSFISVSEQVTGDTVTLTVNHNIPPDMLCPAIITNFQSSYTLQTELASGAYTLNINNVSGQFNIQ